MAERLAHQDAVFLVAERPEYLLAGARVLVFGGPPPGFGAFLEHVRARLPLVPRLRQRVRRSTLELWRPRWAPDLDFDIRRHVRQVASPSTTAGLELESLSETMLNAPVDLDRPPWELWYVEGLAAGNFAACVRFHHALGDGPALLYLLATLFPPAEDAGVRGGENGSDGDVDRAEPGRATVRRMAAGLDPRRVRRAVRRGIHDLALPIALLRQHRPTPAERIPTSLHRRVRLVWVPLADLRRIGSALETTINSLIVAAVAGALRRDAMRSGAPDNNPVALVPVSVRATGDVGLGNRVRSVLCELPVNEPDAVERVRCVSDSLSALIPAARAAGERRSVLGPQAWVDYVTRRRSEGPPPFDLVITNMRGPSTPLRCCGRAAEMLVPSGPNIPLGGPAIMVTSYLDQVGVSITTDPARTRDEAALAADFRASFEELRALVGSPTGGSAAAVRAGVPPPAR